jgi:uncharacterized membrane protein YkvA (DUF1232 family)
MNFNKAQSIIPSQGGVFRDLVLRVKLVMQLMGDRRVNPWFKLIPVAALIYWISPVDLIMGIPGLDAVDDIAVLWFAQYLFIELCPPDVVRELSFKMGSNNSFVNSNIHSKDEEIVDGEVEEL